MQVAIRGGVQIGVKRMGDGPPLVLLHAFPLSKRMWRPQFEALAPHASLLAVDLRGFGASSGWQGAAPSVDAMADDVAQVLDALGVNERVAVAGVSMGGYVALAFAERHRRKLRALALSNTRAEADDPGAKAARASTLARLEAGEAGALRDELIARMTSPVTMEKRPLVMTELRAIAHMQEDRALTDATRALRDRPDRTALLGTIMVPTVVIAGKDDVVSPPASLELLAKRIPRAELVVVEGAGHLPSLEAPEAWNQAALRLLNKLSN